MKKITEEQVSALIAGLERREREALAERHLRVATQGTDLGRRVLPLKRKTRMADVVPIDAGRARRLARTVSGMFFYTPQRG